MKPLYLLLFALLLGGFRQLHAQPARLFDPALAPFYHGVASGDPLPDGVVLWTRITTEQPSADVDYYVARDTTFGEIVAEGTVATDASRDYTVKIDLRGLAPATTYYYVFRHAGRNSIVGRTRTAPAPGVATDQLRFALMSCSNYDAGFFNVYDRVADRADLDAVFHVGDYIYEYADGVYGDPSLPDRVTYPDAEITTLDEYRGRYSLYRLDRGLIRAHQQHPWIVTWDDHEIANDAWEFGAQNHQPATEGDYGKRKAEATRAYFEWLPLRDNADSTVYRAFAYGDLADVSVLDSRHEGRDKQLTDMRDPAFRTDRTALGAEQRAWLVDRLTTSKARWNIVPQQVFFSPFNVGFGAQGGKLTNPDSVFAVENIFLDIWDGYPFERELLIDTIAAAGAKNVVILSGDIHSSFAADVTKQPVLYPLAQTNYLPLPSPGYDPATGRGSVAVEFVTPSVTAANFDENIGAAASARFERVLNNSIPVSPQLSVNYNPHIKFTDLDRHGYVLVDVKSDTLQGDYYYVPTVARVAAGEEWGAGLATASGANHLERVAQPSRPKAEAPALAGERASAFVPAQERGTAAVQLIHSAYRQTLRVELDGEVIVPQFAFRTATPFLEVPAGDSVRLSFIPIGGPVPAADSVSYTVYFEADGRYVAVATGDYDTDRAIDLRIETFAGAPAPGSIGRKNVALLAFHGAKDAPAVVATLLPSGPTAALSYGEFAGYAEVPSRETYTFTVAAAEAPSRILATYRTTFEFWRGRSAVVFANGRPDNNTLQLWVALDNGGTYPLFPVEGDVNDPARQAPPVFADVEAPLLLGVYPNPAGTQQTIRFAVAEAQALSIDLINVQGQRVLQVFRGEVAEGMYSQPVDLSGLPAGAYFYVVESADGRTQTLRAEIGLRP